MTDDMSVDDSGQDPEPEAKLTLASDLAKGFLRSYFAPQRLWLGVSPDAGIEIFKDPEGLWRIRFLPQLLPEQNAEQAFEILKTLAKRHLGLVNEEEFRRREKALSDEIFSLRAELAVSRRKILNEVASWYEQNGFHMDEDDIAPAIRALGNNSV